MGVPADVAGRRFPKRGRRVAQCQRPLSLLVHLPLLSWEPPK